MLDRIFPKQADNSFHGYRLAIFLLVAIVLLRLGIGANSMLDAPNVAVTADGIPLDSYGTAGADTVVALFALLGLFHLLFALLGLAVLIRYRALIPLMYLLLLAQQAGNRLLNFVHPIARLGAGVPQPASVVVLAILAMTIIGLVLSLLRRSDAPTTAPVRSAVS